MKSGLLSIPAVGEWNAFSNQTQCSILVSKQFVDSLGDKYEEVFEKDVCDILNKYATHLVFAENFKINTQELLEQNEFIVNQFGNTIIRKKVEGDISSGIIKELKYYFQKLNQDI